MGFENVIVKNLPYLITILILVSMGGYTLWFFFIKNYKNFDTHELVAISNKHYINNLKTGREELKLYKYQKGGESIINPLTQSYKILPTNKITLEIESKDIRTQDDLFISITTVIIFGIDSSSERSIEVAFESFGHLASRKIKSNDFKKGVLEILKPFVSSAIAKIISSLTYDSIIKEDKFNNRAEEVIEEIFTTMGLIITYISLKDIHIDDSPYLYDRREMMMCREEEKETREEKIRAERELELATLELELLKRKIEAELELKKIKLLKEKKNE